MRFNKITVGTCVALVLTFGLAVGSPHVATFAQSAQTSRTVSGACRAAVRHDTCLRGSGRFRSLRREFDRDIWRHNDQAGSLHSNSDPEQHYVAAGPDAGGLRCPCSASRRRSRIHSGWNAQAIWSRIWTRRSRAAKATGADVLVAPFNDPIGRDAIIQWPGGVNTQLYWHTTAPSYAPLQTVPENRVYVSPDEWMHFVRSFLAFSHGSVVSDDARAPGVEIGRPAETYRRVRIESKFGKLTAFVTDGHLPYPYGREVTGYEVTNLAETLTKAKAAGVQVLVPPYTADQRAAALVQFPGGYIAEIHSSASKYSPPR